MLWWVKNSVDEQRHRKEEYQKSSCSKLRLAMMVVMTTMMMMMMIMMCCLVAGFDSVPLQRALLVLSINELRLVLPVSISICFNDKLISVRSSPTSFFPATDVVSFLPERTTLFS